MRVLVGGWIGSENLGDELLFLALRHKLERRGAVPVPISIDPARTQSLHGVTAVSHHDVPGLIRGMGEAAAYLIGPGGVLQDGSSALSPLYHLSRVGLARVRHRPFAGVGLGAGPIDARMNRVLLRTALRGNAGLGVRDDASAALLRQIGVPGVVVTGDLVLSIDPGEATVGETVCVCLRPWWIGRRYLPRRWRQGKEGWPHPVVQMMASALDQTAKATGLQVRFVAFEGQRDHAIHQVVAGEMKTEAECVLPALSELVREIGSSRAVITMRYHGGLIGAIQGRPPILAGSLPKVRALARDLRVEGMVVDLTPGSLRSLPDRVERAIGLDQEVAEAVETLRNRELGNDRILDRILERV